MVGLASGWMAVRLAVPLPWMLGPLVGCGVAGVLGVRVLEVPATRRLGQAVIGVAIGIRMTPPVLANIVGLLPAIIAAALGVAGLSMAAAHALRVVGRVDARTAFFACAPAGMAEMAGISRRFGGDPEAVSIVHAIRVAGVVLLVPVIAIAVGHAGTVVEGPPTSASPWLLLPILGLGFLVAHLLTRTSVPNGWLLGPLFIAAVVAGVLPAAPGPPGPLMVFAQLAIGVALGCRFRREGILRLPRVALGGLMVTAFFVIMAVAGGGALALLGVLPFATAFLSVAPAGLTEMVLTAKGMQLDPTVVTAFHVVRIAFITAAVSPLFRLYLRLSPSGLRDPGPQAPSLGPEDGGTIKGVGGWEAVEAPWGSLRGRPIRVQGRNDEGS